MKISGVFPPVATAFENGEVSLEKFKGNLHKWREAGVSGYVVFGSNGEYVFLSRAEKVELIKAAREVAGDDRKVIAGTGCESTRETIELTNEVARHGADAGLVLNPNYYNMSNKALINHFKTVADESEIPILIYNVPKFTGVNISPEVVIELSYHPNIVGIKDSTGNVAQLGTFLNGVAEDFSVLVGTAGALYPALSIGVAGGVLALANVAPRECVQIYEAFQNGDHQRASELYLKVLPVNTAVTATYGVPGLKAALDMLGFYGGDPRPPLLPLGESERETLKGILERADLL